VTVVRAGEVILPQPEQVLEAGDEMLFISDHSVQRSIQEAIHSAEPL
jgi:trk system potassium uptake protein TrkA